jgi:predicted alpha/beta superfamily hydrolase
MINSCLKNFVVAFLLLSSLKQAVTASEYRIKGTETLEIRSEINQQEYELYIKLPRSYSKSEKSYPVAIINDAGFSFPIASGVVGLMGGRDIEDLILVGISYAKGSSAQISRTRDYTPTYAPDEKGAHSLEAQRYSGKAKQYIEFIEKEVFPLIKHKYRIDEKNKIFVGHSFSGLLGAYILLVQPELFQKYIIGSPSLWYDKNAIFRLEEEYAQKNKTMKATVFMYIGSEENKNNHKNMVDDVLRYEKTLKSRQYTGLNISTHVLKGATHFSAFPILLTDALKRAVPKNTL